MRATIVLGLLLAACGGGGPEGPGAATPWPADYQRWVCGAIEELESNALPATHDAADAIEALDVDAVAAAADTVADSGRAARGMLDLAPVWDPGTAAVEDLYRATALFSEGGSLVVSGATTTDLAGLGEGRALLKDATAAMAEADLALTDLRAETGFACSEAARATPIGPVSAVAAMTPIPPVRRRAIGLELRLRSGCRCSSL